MTLAANVKLFCRFDDPLLVDQRSGLALSVSGDPVSLVPGVFGTSAGLTPASYLTAGSGLSLTNKFSIGFWLRSCHPGVAKDTSNVIIPLKMPVMSVSGFSYNSGTKVTTLSSPSFVMWEECLATGQNRLSLLIQGSSTSATVVSSPYQPGKWHHFWAVYDGATSKLKIYVDGTPLGIVYGTIPATLASSPSALQINRGIDGPGYAVARNQCSLDDLLVLDTAVDDVETVFRVMSLGANHIAETELANVREVYAGAVFADPETVQTNALTTDGSDLFVARSDGRVLRGRRKAWKCRRSFGSAAEQTALTNQYGAKVTFDRGVLSPTTSIRA